MQITSAMKMVSAAKLKKAQDGITACDRILINDGAHQNLVQLWRHPNPYKIPVELLIAILPTADSAEV